MLKELLFPDKCVVCDEIVDTGEVFCCECKKHLSKVKEPICIQCGKPVEMGEIRCFDCERNEMEFVCNRSVYLYEECMVQAMYALKYRGRKQIAVYMAKECLGNLEDWIRSIQVDAIVPIPLHKKRKRSRGFNQSALIAKEIGSALGIPVYENYLVRVGKTRPQKELNDEQRKNNMKNAFIINENEVQLKQILLLDDIYTTGATMNDASRELRRHGAENVYSLTVCIGRGY